MSRNKNKYQRVNYNLNDDMLEVKVLSNNKVIYKNRCPIYDSMKLNKLGVILKEKFNIDFSKEKIKDEVFKERDWFS